MHYAITITLDGLITDRHESFSPINEETFANNSFYAGQQLLSISAEAEYAGGHYLDEYTQEGLLLPLIIRITMGRAEVPPGYELIGGELVETNVPEEEAPPTLKAKLDEITQQAEAEQRASRVMFRALAQTDVITAADALDNASMFPVWAERVGTDTKVGEYLRHDNGLYRVKQAHKIQAHYPPSTATAALYSRATMPGETLDWTPGSWAKGTKVRHKGKLWVSRVENNTWEPGSPGVYDNIWKEALS